MSLKKLGSIREFDKTIAPNLRYSTRTTDSNRILLANALESTVQNEIEANKLREYKEKITHIDAKKFTYINYECELEGKHITLQIDIKNHLRKTNSGSIKSPQ